MQCQYPTSSLTGLFFVCMQYLLEEYSDCYHGNKLPALRSHDQSHDPGKSKAEDSKKESDADIMRRDVIQARLRQQMSLNCYYIHDYQYMCI